MPRARPSHGRGCYRGGCRPVAPRLTAHPSTAGLTAQAATAHNWIGDAWSTHILRQSYPSTASYFFDSSGSRHGHAIASSG